MQLFSLEHIHNQVIHFPIALLSASVLFDLIGFYSDNKKMYSTSWYLLILGTLSTMSAVLTGFIADKNSRPYVRTVPYFHNTWFNTNFRQLTTSFTSYLALCKQSNGNKTHFCIFSCQYSRYFNTVLWWTLRGCHCRPNINDTDKPFDTKRTCFNLYT